jgi:hypothetical protein
MPISRKRKKKSKLRSSVKVYQRSSKNLWSTAENLVSQTSLIMRTSFNYSKTVWRKMVSTLKFQISYGIKIDLLLRKRQSRNRCLLLLIKNQRLNK